MGERAVFHVVHDQRADAWKVERDGSKRAVATADTKDEAVTAARERANENGFGQVVVHRMDGSIETEYTYGADPQTTPG